jgi:serine/threonine-protein kinase RsbW
MRSSPFFMTWMPPLPRFANREESLLSAGARASAAPETLMDDPQDRLELDSRLTELNRVQPWIESLADRHGFGKDARFSMQLCMEEALANVVLHGYRNQPGHPIVVEASATPDALFFAINDNAAPFLPVEPADDSERHATLESIQPGGNGIRLLHRFAGSLLYESLPEGNRLTIGFPLPIKTAADIPE